MARKNFIDSFNMLDAVSLADPHTSPPTNVLKLDRASLYVSWTDLLAVGELEVQGRIGEDNAWFIVDFSEPLEIKPDYNGEFQIIFNELPFTDIRLIYTPTSGSGSLTATLTSKTVGA